MIAAAGVVLGVIAVAANPDLRVIAFVAIVVAIAVDRARFELMKVARAVTLEGDTLHWHARLRSGVIAITDIERVSLRGPYSAIDARRLRVMVPIGPGWSTVLAALRERLPAVPIRLPHERPVIRRRPT